MSGIYGYITDKKNREKARDLSALERWNKAYGEGSPDSFSFEEGYLGCCIERLSDQKPVCAGVIRRGGIYAVIDAVIYNRSEIAADNSLSSDLSDEELLLELILKRGEKALSKVNGDFAGAVYNSDKKTLLLFRDHMGVRPLFYQASDEGVVFSTDIRGLLGLSFVDKAISPKWVYKTMNSSFAIEPTKTEYRNIFAVRPGSSMEIDLSGADAKPREKIYWRVGRHKIKLFSDKAYQEKMRELITDAVKIRLDAVSGKVGAELSGGIDSGVIDILINRFGRDCVYYSWSESPDRVPFVDRDERLVINDICAQEGITCHYEDSELDENSVLFRKTKETGAEPDLKEKEAIRYRLPAYVNALLISNTAEYVKKNGGRVVFTGHGGDEGVSHRCNPYELFHFHEFYHYFRYMFSTTNGQKNRVKNTLKKCRYSLTTVRKAFNTPNIPDFMARDFLSRALRENSSDFALTPKYFAYDPIAYINAGGTRNRLDNVSILGAYSGVRYMIPFVDYRVIDFAVSIPRYQYIRGRRDRYIYREAFKDIMPDSLYRQTLKDDISGMRQEEEDWFPEFDELRKSTVQRLDREYWKDMLDFEALEAWAMSGRPAESERAQQEFALICVFQCLMAQNAVDKLT